MKTIVFKVETVDNFDKRYLHNDFKKAIKKAIEEKAEICVEISDIKKVFNITCNDGETIYINDDKIQVIKETSYKNDYISTTYMIIRRLNTLATRILLRRLNIMI